MMNKKIAENLLSRLGQRARVVNEAYAIIDLLATRPCGKRGRCQTPGSVPVPCNPCAARAIRSDLGEVVGIAKDAATADSERDQLLAAAKKLLAKWKDTNAPQVWLRAEIEELRAASGGE